MKIIVAENAGFCFGVARAIESIESLIKKTDKKIYTLGHVIHNKQVVDELYCKGVTTIDDISARLEPGCVVIRAHGASPEEYEEIKRAGHEIIDVTCPYVRKIQLLVKEKHEEGCQIVIIGDRNHPEVIAINGWCGNSAVIVNKPDEIKDIPISAEKICVVAQTTTVYEKWLNITEEIDKLSKTVEKFDTICNATISRQKEGSEIASEVDLMIVVGGSGSSNTQKLFETCREYCPNTIKVETADCLAGIDLTNINSIGITAGTSTPGRIIREVAEKMEELKNDEVESVSGESVANESGAGGKVESEIAESALGENAVSEISGSEVSEIAESALGESAVGEISGSEVSVDNEGESIENSGISAADTGIIEEVGAAGEEKEMSFEEALQESLMPLRSGTIVKGTIARLDETDIYVNLNFKYEGVIPVDEYSSDKNFDPAASIKAGDEIEVFVLRVNEKDGIVNLSRKVIEEKDNWEYLKKAKREKTPVEVKIVSLTNGGLNALTKGIKVFIPASQASSRFTKDLTPFVGTGASVRILEIDQKKKKVVASRRVIQDEEKTRNESAIWENIEEGKEYEGTVSGLTDFGAFVDIGGVDGLVHITELSWRKIKHPSEVVAKGDKLKVRILEFDKEKKRVSLGYKKIEDNPWNKAGERYRAEDIIKGKVVRILPFGAFVEIETGLDGLVHISRISNKRLKKVEEVLKIGQEIEAKILEVDEGNMRINLSIKAVNPIDPPETHGENKPGKVKTVENKTAAQTDEKKEENIEKPAAEQLAEEGRGEETQKVKETETEAKIPNFHKEELSNTIGDFLGDVDLSDFKEKKSDKDGE